MKQTFWRWLGLALPLALFSPGLFAQERMATSRSLETAKVLGVVAHPEGRIFDWIAHTPVPVYDDYPFYDMKLQVGNQCYIVRYEAQTGYYPSAWKPGKTVQARVSNGVVYLVRYDGEEVPTGILQRCSTPR